MKNRQKGFPFYYGVSLPTEIHTTLTSMLKNVSCQQIKDYEVSKTLSLEPSKFRVGQKDPLILSVVSDTETVETNRVEKPHSVISKDHSLDLIYSFPE